MKNQLTVFVLGLIFATSCQNNPTHYELTIQTTGIEDINKLYLLKEIGEIIDTSESSNGVFIFSGELKEPQLCAVYSEEYPNKMKVLILDYGKTNIKGELSMFSDSEVSFEFEKNNKLREHFQNLFTEYENDNLAKILPEYRKAQRENNLDKVNIYNAKLDSLALDMREKIYKFVEINSNNHGMAEVISEELIPRSYLKPEEL